MKPLFLPRRIERTTLIGVWCAAVLIGIALAASLVRLEGMAVVLLAGAGLLLGFKRTWGAAIVIVVSGLLFGMWRGTIEQSRAMELAAYYGQEVILSGRIAADPEEKREGRYVVRFGDVAIDGRKQTGAVQVTLDYDKPLSRGDVVNVRGVLRPGFGGYQARMGYAKQVQVYKAALPEIAIRDNFASSIRRAIPEPEASLGLGFLLGQRTALPDDITEDFKLLGLTHIVVASGYNLTILVRIARRIFEKVSKFQATAVSLGLVLAFATITGFSASMTRAALVTVLVVWAWHYGRRIHPLVLILFAAAVTAVWNPFYVWSDIAWYLSFLAFVGVLLIAPLLVHRLYGESKPSLPVQIVIETICAQIATLPLILYLFGVFPVLSLIANVLIVPFIPLIMLLTFVAGAAGFIVPMLSPVAGLLAQLLLSYVITLSETLASVSWASFNITFSLIAMVASYFLITGLMVMLWFRIRYDFLRRSFIE